MTEEKPRDLLDLQKLAATEGRDRALRARLDTLQLVTFVRNSEPSHSDPIGRHPTSGRPVFPDKKRQGSDIKSGETWFCELEEYRPVTGAPVYYANPVAKVDASYLFDLRPDQVDKVLAALQLTSQSTLLDLARKRIQDELEKAAQSRVEAMQRERDAARSEADSLHAEVTRLSDSAGTLRREVEALRAAPPSPAPPSRVEPSQEAVSSAPSNGPPNWFTIGASSLSPLFIDRNSASRIRSEMFRDGRYFVHVSPDRRLLLVRSHPEGNLVATGNTLEVPGLDVLRPFDRPEQLPATLEARGGGLLLRLREGA